MKNAVGKLEYGFPVFKFLRHQTCLRVEGSISKLRTLNLEMEGQ